MISSLLYICGAPGVGKSTVMRQLRSSWDCEVMSEPPVPHVRLRHLNTGRIMGVELGVPRENFPGTDALSMSISPYALQFLSTSYAPFALGEGARLATRPFIGGLAQRGVRTTLVYLTADQELLDARWRARGAKQNPSWRKGAATRAAGVVTWFRSHLGQDGFHRLVTVKVDGKTPGEIAGQITAEFPDVGPWAAGVPAQPAVGD